MQLLKSTRALLLGVALLFGSGAFAANSLYFVGSCDVELKGEPVDKSSFNLDIGNGNPAHDKMDIDVPDNNGISRKFVVHSRLYVDKNRVAIADFILTPKGQIFGTAFATAHDVHRGTILTFSSVLLGDYRVKCTGNVL